MSWAALLKSAGSKVAQQSGKKIAANLTKQTVKGVAVDKVKSIVKKKKVKGKDIAKKMLGGGEGESSGGGALSIRPSSSIVSSAASGLAPSIEKDEGGSLVVGNDSKELGLTPFMESVTRVKDSVGNIKDALNDNSEDVKERLEKQRLLNAFLDRKEQEEALEAKKKPLGIGKKLLKPVKDAAEGFLSKLLRFFKATLLGMLVNALVGGARDVVVAFLAGYKAYRMAKDAVVKFVLKLRGNIGKGISNAGKAISKVGTSIGNFLGKVRTVLVGWIKNTIKVVREGVRQGGRVGGKILQAVKPRQRLRQTFQAVNKFRKNPLQTLKSIQNSGIGQKVGGVINKGKDIVNKVKDFKPGKAAEGMFKGIKNWGARKWKGAVEFGSKKWKALTQWADDIAKNALKWTDDVVKGGLAKAAKWRKQLGDIAELMKNPAKLADKVKGMLSGKMNKMVDSNDIIKKVKDIAKDPKKAVDGIKKFVKQVGKNKNVLKTRKVLQKAAKLKIAGIDAVLAALMGIIDYTAFGESPINAVLRAAGSLIGYTAGFAIGAPFGGVPGFITGMAGAWAGEKAADFIAAALSKTDLGKTPDPIMDDGRMLVRDPFSGQGEGERMDNIQEAKLGETSKDNTASEISESASYEEDGGEETVIIDGGETAAAPASLAGQTKFIPLGVTKETILNSNHEANTNAALFKV